jgi:hypothetical protein
MTTLEDNINDYSSYLSSYHKIKDADPVFGSEGESSDGASDPDDKTSKQWSPEPSNERRFGDCAFFEICFFRWIGAAPKAHGVERRRPGAVARRHSRRLNVQNPNTRF